MKSVLSVFPLALQREIKQRLEEFEMPDESIVQEIESALKVRYRKQRRPVNYSVMLESFDDLVTLSDNELSILFHSVDLTTAMLALIGADPVLIARTTKHFSPTEEHHMHKRLKQMQSIDDEDIEQARRIILEQYNATLR
jgi:flagellar motor switch protein FliG